jgi:hypothetical protein
MRVTPEAPRLALTLRAGLLLLCLAAHLTADLAWLYQNNAGPARMAQTGQLAPGERAADPHGDGAVPLAALPAACLALVLLLVLRLGRLAAMAGPPLFHPPALLPR